MKTKAVIYARVSSSNDRQDTTRQIEDLRKYAVSQNIEIVNVFQEHISGAKKNEERQVLTDCLNYCTTHSVNYLYYQSFRDLEEVHCRFFALQKYCMRQRYLFIYRTWGFTHYKLMQGQSHCFSIDYYVGRNGKHRTVKHTIPLKQWKG